MLIQKHIAIILYSESNLLALKKQVRLLLAEMHEIDAALMWRPNCDVVGKPHVESVRAEQYKVPYQFKLQEAFKNCFDALSMDRMTKHIFFITDTVREDWLFRMNLVLRQFNRIRSECTISFIGFGDKYDRAQFEKLSTGFPEDRCETRHFDNIDDVSCYMKTIYGEMS